MKGSTSIGELFNVLNRNMSAAEIKTAMVNAEISSAITDERIKLGMTQKEFSDFMGVSQGMVSKWESGDYNFTISSISKIFDKLNMDFGFSIKKDEGWKDFSRPTENIEVSMSSQQKVKREDFTLLILSA